MKKCKNCGKCLSDYEAKHHECEDEDGSIIEDIIDIGIIGLGLSMLGNDNDSASSLGGSSSDNDFSGGGGSFDGGGSSGDW